MKGILEFVLPEDQEPFRLAQEAQRWKNVVSEFDEHLRQILKYGTGLSKNEDKMLQDWREKLHEIMKDEGVGLF